jgi:hypothetical protein
MPAPQIPNPLGAFGYAPPDIPAGSLTVEVQNNSTRDIQRGEFVKWTGMASSSFYPLTYAVSATTGPIDGPIVFGVAAELIQSVQPTTATTGSVTNVAPRKATGEVVVYGFAYANIISPPGTGTPLPNYLSIGTTSVTGGIGSSANFGVAMATSTATTAGLIATSSLPIIGALVGIANSSVSASSTLSGTTNLYPIFVAKM